MTWYYPFLFGISGGEILILLLLVLLLFGPKKIPEIARMIGRGMNEVKKVQREINTEIHRYSSDIEKEAKEMQSEIKKITEEPTDNASKAAHSKNSVNEAPAKDAANIRQRDSKGLENEQHSSNQADNDTGPEVKDNEQDLPYPYGPGTDKK